MSSTAAVHPGPVSAILAHVTGSASRRSPVTSASVCGDTLAQTARRSSLATRNPVVIGALVGLIQMVTPAHAPRIIREFSATCSSTHAPARPVKTEVFVHRPVAADSRANALNVSPDIRASLIPGPVRPVRASSTQTVPTLGMTLFVTAKGIIPVSVVTRASTAIGNPVRTAAAAARTARVFVQKDSQDRTAARMWTSVQEEICATTASV